MIHIVMAGLVPAIHVLVLADASRRGCPAPSRAYGAWLASRRNIGGEHLPDAGAHGLALRLAQAGERMRLVGDAGRALEYDQAPAEAQRLLDRMGDENPGRPGLAQ